MSGTERPDFSGWTCPAPLRNYPTVVMGHGSGGKMTSDLIRHLFAPQFDNDLLAQMADATVIGLPPIADGVSLTADGDTRYAIRDMRLAFTTDSFVVSPLFFPGGDLGSLAVHGTVNDLAMSGARPLYLSAGFILEEGLPL